MSEAVRFRLADEWLRAAKAGGVDFRHADSKPGDRGKRDVRRRRVRSWGAGRRYDSVLEQERRDMSELASGD